MSNNIAKADFPGQINRVEAAPLEPHTVVGDVAGAEYANSSEIPSANLYKGCHVREYVNTDHYLDLVWTGVGFETHGATVDITYDELSYLQLHDLLITGQYYVINDYQCKYLIPYTVSEDLTDWGIGAGDTVLDDYGNIICSPAGVINTDVYNGNPYGDMTSSENPVVPVERIRVQATSPGTIGIVAWSEDYPDEMLYYDFENIEFTDGEGTFHSRPGWVRQRFNIKNKVDIKVELSLSDGGDYRYIRFRRWKVDFDASYANTSGNLPTVNTFGTQEEQFYFVPYPNFACGVKPDDFDFTSYTGAANDPAASSYSSSFYENVVTITDVKEFKDYYAVNVDTQSYYSFYDVKLYLQNTVLKPVNVGSYLYPYYNNFKINFASNSTISTNAVFNVFFSYLSENVHMFNLTDEYYSHYSVYSYGWMQNTLSLNSLSGLKIESTAFVYHSLITAKYQSGRIINTLQASILHGYSGDVEVMISSYVRLGNASRNEGDNALIRVIDSLVSTDTMTSRVYFGELEKCNCYLSGGDYTIEKADNINIGLSGSHKDLTGCKILVPLSLDLDDSAINNAVVNKVSPDGEVWYDAIDNAGVVTPTKLM